MEDMPTILREQWLRDAVQAMAPLLEPAQIVLPESWAVSIGFPRSKKAIGECWHSGLSASGKTTTMFISPELADFAAVGGVLLHEMTHACLGAGCGHGPKFVRACRAIGLTNNPPTSASPGPELDRQVRDLLTALGPYPHDALVRKPGEKRGVKGGYWPVFESPEDPRYRIQISERALEEYGPPLCPLSGEPMRLADGRAPAWPRKAGE